MNRLLVAAAALALLGGCPAPDPTGGLPSTPYTQAVDWAQFVCAAQPVLIRRCSYLACHGKADHALRIYSPGKLRLAPVKSRMDRDATLTPAEVANNFRSAAGLVWPATGNGPVADPTQIPLLRKPLAAAFGGSEHQGVAIFPVAPNTALDNDAEWRALSDWAHGAKAPRPLPADCQALFDAIGLDPNGGPG